MKTKIPIKAIVMLLSIAFLVEQSYAQEKKEKIQKKQENVIEKKIEKDEDVNNFSFYCNYGYGKKCHNLKRCGMKEFCCLPNLTNEQEEKIKNLRIQHQKELLPLKNQLDEKKAKLKSVSTGDNIDINSVYATIDEISKIKTEIAKKRITHRLEVRKLLNEEQKLYFDMHFPNRSKCCEKNFHPKHHKYGYYRNINEEKSKILDELYDEF